MNAPVVHGELVQWRGAPDAGPPPWATPLAQPLAEVGQANQAWATLGRASRAVGRSALGAGLLALAWLIVVRGWWRWATDQAGRAGRAEATARGDHVAELHFRRRAILRTRLRVGLSVLVTAPILGGGGLVAWRTWPPTTGEWVVLLAVHTVVMWVTAAGCAGIGQRASGPAPAPPAPAVAWVPVQQVAQPTAPALDHVQRAFVAAGIGTAGAPVHVERQERASDGWTAVVDLGEGRPAALALGRADRLAAALDVPVARLHLEELDQRRVTVHVAARDRSGERATSPLAGAQRWSILSQPVPVGRTARGAPVAVHLFRQGVLLGGRPQMGKTTAMRLLVLAGLLDPAVDVWLADGKPGADWAAVRPLARRHVGDDAAACAAMLTEVVAEMQRTYAAAAAGEPGFEHGHISAGALDAGHRLHLVVVDEIQVFLDDPTHGKAILALAADLARRGPAAGIHLVVATQRPDAVTLPPVLREQLAVRIGLACSTSTAPIVVGRDAVAAGLDPSRIKQPGVAVVVGGHEMAGEGAVVQVDGMDLPTFTRAANRAGIVRARAGLLPVERPLPDLEQVIDGGGAEQQERLCRDVLAVFEPAEPALPSAVIADRLRASGWELDANELGRRLAADPLRVRSGRWRPATGGQPVRGFRRVDLLDAVAA